METLSVKKKNRHGIAHTPVSFSPSGVKHFLINTLVTCLADIQRKLTNKNQKPNSEMIYCLKDNSLQ